MEGMHVLNVREGFMHEDVCFGSEVKRGMNVLIECNGVILKALIDTGCGPNVMFKNAYDRIERESSYFIDSLPIGLYGTSV